jgi:hypothetical protein
LVIPVLAAEGIGPIESVKRSAQLLKKTWGEQLIGNIGIGLFFGLIILGIVIISVPVAIYTSMHNMHLITIIVGVAAGISVITLFLISSTLTTVYTAALYRYAAKGDVVYGFSRSMLMNSFTRK